MLSAIAMSPWRCTASNLPSGRAVMLTLESQWPSYPVLTLFGLANRPPPCPPDESVFGFGYGHEVQGPSSDEDVNIVKGTTSLTTTAYVPSLSTMAEVLWPWC